MNRNQKQFRPSFIEIAIIIVILCLGLVFIWFMFNDVKNQSIRNDVELGKSIVATLPADKISQLSADPGDTIKPAYSELKTIFQKIISENKKARFTYLYVQRNGKYYFLLDSEPANSPDYSPPGQEYTEISEAFKIPFADGISTVTPAITDRWGTWITILVPVKNAETGKTIAVYGMDINASSWYRNILIEVAETSILVILLILLSLLSMRFFAKNRFLKREISERVNAENSLLDSEARYRLLYENASIGIYQTTPDGRVLLSNMALLNILGYKSFDELKERDIEKGDFDPTYSRAEFKRLMETEGEIRGLESVWNRQDGKRYIYVKMQKLFVTTWAIFYITMAQ